MVDGPQFYDDDDVFNTYWLHRKRPDNPNDALETPIILNMIGNVKYTNILDLGCGNGEFGNLLLTMGCQTYTGVDGSFKMISLARKNLTSKKAALIYGRIENCEFPDDHYHLIVSRLTLHYIENLENLLNLLRPSLKQGGKIVFSVEHPIITSHNEALSMNNGKRITWLVDDYFKTGAREVEWLEAKVTKYHRTIEDYFTLFEKTGFSVMSLRESNPKRENFVNEEEFERRKRIPLFLFFALQAKSD